MKSVKLLAIVPFFLMLSCVSSKKFKSLQSDYNTSQTNQKNCADELRDAEAKNSQLTSDKAAMQTRVTDLQTQVDYLKQNSNQVIGALQDMSVLNNSQADNLKKSLTEMQQKDSYIMNLQSAIARKDSMNMILVTNLKGALGNDSDVNIKVEKGVIYVDISDKLLFNSGRYTVTEKAKVVLSKVAQVLNAHPEIEFMVEGFTDDVPIHTDCIEDNWDLSVKRSTSVIRILENEYKISPERITAGGHGKYAPIAPNDTKEGKALNRRTSIIILPQLDQFFKLMTKQ